MNIYIGHSRNMDFKNGLYKTIRESKLNEEHNIILPHENSDEPYNSKEFLSTTCDLVIADVSDISLGLGVELGWADSLNVPIICMYKRGSKVSNSLKVLTEHFVVYETEEDMITQLTNLLPEYTNGCTRKSL